ncbi:hypothetical protein HMPREF0551_1641 [Lautropia mirabilis ATCC 51599]|uniref:Uncharacterized protein n=1 Tax=Lautropia mirabilis ATCC 51599 TaxID=887898 RepID=E7RY77_9BURK|nr:hypothetical protein HMPREF0551_1641 [Lautropia mirabilis ATCC 51599]
MVSCCGPRAGKQKSPAAPPSRKQGQFFILVESRRTRLMHVRPDRAAPCPRPCAGQGAT